MFEGFASYGYLFFNSFLASTLLPFGSEWLLVLLVRDGGDPLVLVLTASFGNYLGACTSYYIGLRGREAVQRRLKFSNADLERAENLFRAYGSYALLFTWLPVLGDALTVVGGLLKLRFLRFSILVFTGKFLRYLAVTYIAITV